MYIKRLMNVDITTSSSNVKKIQPSFCCISIRIIQNNNCKIFQISLLQEGYGTDLNKPPSHVSGTSTIDSEVKSEDSGASLGSRPSQDDCDNVSVTSLGSVSTAATNTLETEELIDKLRS